MAILLSTKSFPPVVGGSSFLLYELLKHWDTNDLYVVHGVNDPPKNGDHFLPFERKQVLLLGSPLWTLRLQRRTPRLLIHLVKYQLKKMIRLYPITHIYAHYPNGIFTVAAYQVAKQYDLPLTIYYDILWDKGDNSTDTELAKKYEKQVIEYASNHFAITEYAVEKLSKKFGKLFHLIPHTIDLKYLKPEPKNTIHTNRPKIHFAGGIYSRMNKDSILRIYEALCEELDDFELELCTGSVPFELESDSRIVKRYLSKENLLSSQADADLLLLPQAFESEIPEMLRNNFPTKTMEYLCSGTPILVHSPEDSYLSWITRKHEFGALVDKPNIKELKRTIRHIFEDQEYRHYLVDNAKKFARLRDSKYWSEYLFSQITQTL